MNTNGEQFHKTNNYH